MFPTLPLFSVSPTPAVLPTVQLNSHMNYLELASDPTCSGSVPQDCPPLRASLKFRFPCYLHVCLNWLQKAGFPTKFINLLDQLRTQEDALLTGHFIINNTSEQPGEEGHGVRRGRVLSTGASVTMELKSVTSNSQHGHGLTTSEALNPIIRGFCGGFSM